MGTGVLVLRPPVLLMRWIKRFWDYLGSTKVWWGVN